MTLHRPEISDDMRRFAAATLELAAAQMPSAEPELAAAQELATEQQPSSERDAETGDDYLLMPTPTLFGKRWRMRYSGRWDTFYCGSDDEHPHWRFSAVHGKAVRA